MTPKSIAIAGCGVAGLALAALMAREGTKVVVFDRLDAPRPVGSGLIVQPAGLAVLDEIGVAEPIRQLGSEINRLYGRAQPSGRVVLDVRYSARGRNAAMGVAVHRGALFQVLYDAAIGAGAEIVSGREIVGASSGRLVFDDGTMSAPFDLVVDALGVRSPLSRLPEAPLPYGALWATLDLQGIFDHHALEQRYERARKMVGVLPIGRTPGGKNQQCAFFWSLRHADRQMWEANSLDAWKADVLKLWPDTAGLVDQIHDRRQLVFAAYAHRTLASPLGDGLVHVGDSWRCTSPQLGQGANMALLDAYALARALGSGGDLRDRLGRYSRARVLHTRIYQSVSWLFTPAYQSDSAALAFARDWLLAPVSRVWPMPPLLAGLVGGAIGSPLKMIDALGDG